MTVFFLIEKKWKRREELLALQSPLGFSVLGLFSVFPILALCCRICLNLSPSLLRSNSSLSLSLFQLPAWCHHGFRPSLILLWWHRGSSSVPQTPQHCKFGSLPHAAHSLQLSASDQSSYSGLPLLDWVQNRITHWFDVEVWYTDSVCCGPLTSWRSVGWGPKKGKQHCTFSFFCFPTVAGKLFQICKSEKLMFIETEKFQRALSADSLCICYLVWAVHSPIEAQCSVNAAMPIISNANHDFSNLSVSDDSSLDHIFTEIPETETIKVWTRLLVNLMVREDLY